MLAMGSEQNILTFQTLRRLLQYKIIMTLLNAIALSYTSTVIPLIDDRVLL
jgi:hypothetical protein